MSLWSPSHSICRPLHADSLKESMQKVSFARISIEDRVKKRKILRRPKLG